ncbi:MAG: ABC transporter ATP-binding protein [Chloroflexi bacterium]|nr:ABC transporter ATP-binding protein [Chloroflexota bacterium]
MMAVAQAPAATAVLSVRGLKIEFRTEGISFHAVDGVDLDIYPGETAGIVGESGCGKSVTALSILGLIPRPPGYVSADSMRFESEELLQLGVDELRKVRGAGISMIFQEPMTSLDPSFTVQSQMSEVLTAHRGLRGAAIEKESIAVLERLRMPNPRAILRQYPFELSGGMRQRVMIGLAMACSPRLLIADEPTTALDVTVQAQILALLKRIQRDTGTSVLLITHDLGVVAQNCDRVYVMYAGRVVESAPVTDLFKDPLHPYTRALLKAIPNTRGGDEELAVIPGEVPTPARFPAGCRFHPRCASRMDHCDKAIPRLVERKPGHSVACYLYGPETVTA